MPTLYEVLDVPEDATDEQIKKSYRANALRYHPDKNPSDQTADQFKAINHAYEVLSDTMKRKQYDLTLHPPPTTGFQFNISYHTSKPAEPAPPQQVTVDVTLEQVITGAVIEKLMKWQEDCGFCQPPTCPACKGSGIVHQQIQMGFMTMMSMQTCQHCRGVRTRPDCQVCNNKRNLDHETLVHLHMKPGQPPQSSFEHLRWQFITQDAVHDTYERRNVHDLVLKRCESVSIHQSLYGFTREVPQLNGPAIRFFCKRFPINPTGSVGRLKGFGLPHLDQPEKRGDILISFVLEWPTDGAALVKPDTELIVEPGMVELVFD